MDAVAGYMVLRMRCLEMGCSGMISRANLVAKRCCLIAEEEASGVVGGEQRKSNDASRQTMVTLAMECM